MQRSPRRASVSFALPGLLYCLACAPAAERGAGEAAAPGGPVRVLDTAAPMPDGGRLADFHEVSAGGGWIAFLGYARRADGVVAPAGLYRRSPAGAVGRVAAAEDPVPDRPERRFGSIQALYQEATQTVFMGAGDGCAGLFRAPVDGGPVATIADCETATGDGASLARFGAFAAEDGVTVFAAAGPGGEWSLWADEGDGPRRLLGPREPLGGPPLAALSPFSLSYRAGRLAFAAANASGAGIWTRDPAGALAAALAAERAAGAFQSFDGVSLLADGLAFRAATPTSHGIYLLDATGAVRPLADTAGGGAAGVPFAGFAEGPVAGGFFVGAYRAADGSAIEGLFVASDGSVRCLLRTGGALDGGDVAGFEIDPQPGTDGTLAFPVQFEDGSAAIYRVTADTPAGC